MTVIPIQRAVISKKVKKLFKKSSKKSIIIFHSNQKLYNTFPSCPQIKCADMTLLLSVVGPFLIKLELITAGSHTCRIKKPLLDVSISSLVFGKKVAFINLSQC
jgi:hypothetical protein